MTSGCIAAASRSQCATSTSRWRVTSARRSGYLDKACGALPFEAACNGLKQFREGDMTWSRSLLMLGVVLPLAACGSEAAKGPEIKPVRTVVVDPKPMEDDRRAVGEVRP